MLSMLLQSRWSSGWVVTGSVVLTMVVASACSSGADSNHKPGPTGGTSGSGAAGSGGTAGSGAAGSGGTGGWAPTCTTGETMECYSGPAKTVDFGRCRPGTRSCQAGGVFGDCVGEVHPAEEICNGQDDDCDGEVDEGCSCNAGSIQDCYSGPAGTQGVGACTSGLQDCQVDGSWSTCMGEFTPQAELCNGLDDDCNGVVDDISGVLLYRLDTATVSWTSQQLSSAWTGPNAPSPCTPIATVFHAYDFGQLMVFTTSGQLHLREHGTWQPPVPGYSRFQNLPAQLDAVWQLPWAWHSGGGGAVRTDVTFSADPYFYFYNYYGNSDTTLNDSGLLTPKVNGPPRPGTRDRWSFERLSAGAPTATLGLMTNSEDGQLYQMGVDLQWHSWPDPRSHPYFNAPGAPDANACVAAWFDIDSQSAYFICS